MKRFKFLFLIMFFPTMLSVVSCVILDRKCLKEPWSRLEIRRRDSFFNPTVTSGRIYMTKEARTRKEPLPPIIVDEPDILHNIRQSFPAGVLKSSIRPSHILSFECDVTTVSGKHILLYYNDTAYDYKTKRSYIQGKITASISGGGDFDCRGSSADLFFEQMWIECRKNGLFDGTFSEFIVTSDNERLAFLKQFQDRDYRLEQELRKGSQTSATSIVILSPSSFDFGEVTELERPVLTATLRNDGDKIVHVTDVVRTCVCADLDLSTTNLPPGGSAEVRCTLDPNVFSGPFQKTFFIKTDDPATPSITIPICGTVLELWEVDPDKWFQIRASDTNAVLRVKAAPDVRQTRCHWRQSSPSRLHPLYWASGRRRRCWISIMKRDCDDGR